MRTFAAVAVIGVAVSSILCACGGQISDPDGPSSFKGSGTSLNDTYRPMVPQQSGTSATEVETGKSDLAQLSERVRRLQQELSQVQQQLATLAGSTPEPTVASANQSVTGVARNAVESAFQQDTSHSNWSRDTDKLVRQAFSAVGFSLGSELRSIECRTSICQVAISLEASDAAEQKLAAIYGQVAHILPEIAAVQREEGGGRYSTVLYLSR